MAFIEHKIQPLARDTGVRATLRKFGKNPAKLVIALNPATIKELGFVAGDKVQAFVGADEDAGKIRLTKNNSVGTFALKTRHGRQPDYVFELDVVPGLPDETQSARFCQWVSPKAGTIDIDLPSWAKRAAKAAVPQALAKCHTDGRPNIHPNAKPIANFDPTAQREAIERAKRLAPAPDFSGKAPPKTKAAIMDAVSKF